MPTGYTWARTGTRPLLRYEAPQGRRVNVLGALAPRGPRPRFVHVVVPALLLTERAGHLVA